VARGRLSARQGELLSRGLRYGPSRTFQRHLRRHHNEWLTFLWHPRELEATNWRGEQAIRPAVIFRKMSGGHRSERGARTHDILTSVLRTAAQRGADAMDLLAQMLRAPQPLALAIAPRAP
jgi:transposase